MGWAVSVPYSAATARNWLRTGGVTQRLCAAPSSRPPSHEPTHCSSCTVGRPLHYERPWPSWSPLLGGRQSAGAGLVFSFGRSTSGHVP